MLTPFNYWQVIAMAQELMMNLTMFFQFISLFIILHGILGPFCIQFKEIFSGIVLAEFKFQAWVKDPFVYIYHSHSQFEADSIAASPIRPIIRVRQLPDQLECNHPTGNGSSIAEPAKPICFSSRSVCRLTILFVPGLSCNNKKYHLTKLVSGLI